MVPDRHVKPSLDVALPTINGSGAAAPSGFNLLDRVELSAAPPVPLTGAGVTVAVIDSGIAVSDDLKTSLGLDRVIVRWSATPGLDTDEFGHGTHVAGIIGGNGKASSGPYATRTFRGVAPDVRLISLKVLGEDGSGEVSDVLEAIDWILDNQSSYGIRIVNISLGHPVVETCVKDPLCRAVEAMSTAGVVVVVSAGSGATLYVSATGPPRPVRLQRASTAASPVSGTLDFTDYNAPQRVVAPAGAIDIAKVRG